MRANNGNKPGMSFTHRKEINHKEDQTQAIVINLLAPHELVVCKHPNCGKRLTLREQLFGNKCINHSISTKQPDPTDFEMFR